MSPFKTIAQVTLLASLALAAAAPSFAQSRKPHERALTITRHTGQARGTGIEYRNGGNEIVAWGGFSANGYGYGGRIGSEAARREARNEAVRLRTSGVYGYGFDGLGGTFDDGELNNGPGFGYNNPNYGNAFSSYVGYNGLPSNLAFGPGFANRHITDSDDFDSDADIPSPAPAELGYSATRAAFSPLD